MLKWLRRFKAPPFSYTAHVYLKDTWRCQLCERLVHANALASHARIEHGMDTIHGTLSLNEYSPSCSIVISINWKNVPWWKRLLAVAALPYQLVRLVCIGKADFLKLTHHSAHRDAAL